jgi:hypothetical protein
MALNVEKLKTDLENVGLYEEAKAFREERRKAWLERGFSAPEAANRSIHDMAERYERERRRLLGRLERSDVLEQNVDPSRFKSPSCTIRAARKWVAQVIMRNPVDIKPEDCPGEEAWNILMTWINKPEDFLGGLIQSSKMGKDEVDGEKREDDGRDVIGKLEKARKAFEREMAAC